MNLTLLIVNAYAAAMIGRLRSLPMTFVGALIVGLLDAYTLAYLPTGQQYCSRSSASPSRSSCCSSVLLVMPQARLRGHSARHPREIVPRPPWLGSLG